MSFKPTHYLPVERLDPETTRPRAGFTTWRVSDGGWYEVRITADVIPADQLVPVKHAPAVDVVVDAALGRARQQVDEAQKDKEKLAEEVCRLSDEASEARAKFDALVTSLNHAVAALRQDALLSTGGRAGGIEVGLQLIEMIRREHAPEPSKADRLRRLADAMAGGPGDSAIRRDMRTLADEMDAEASA